MSMICRCLNGGYINFAICDFYQDHGYTQLTALVLQHLLALDPSETDSNPKFRRALNKFVTDLFRKQTEFLFTKLDPPMTNSLFCEIILKSVRSQQHFMILDALLTIDHVN